MEHSDDIGRENKNETFESVSNNINDLMSKVKITGLSIAVIKDKNVIWSNGFGFSDKENKLNATQHTKYLISKNLYK